MQEEGLVSLEELINSNTSPAPYAKILELAAIVRENVNSWREQRNQNRAVAANWQAGAGGENEALHLDGWDTKSPIFEKNAIFPRAAFPTQILLFLFRNTSTK